MENELEKIKLSLLTILCNATQIYRRTIPDDRKEAYRQNLKRLILRLIPKIDSNTIKNPDIRNAIKELSKKSGVSIGAAQKPINVYLKFYCVIQNKREEILRELDCPIDSRIQIRNRLGGIPLIDIDYDIYVAMQDQLEKKHGMRILADIKAYDEVKMY